jgi:hypothetical protein
MGHHSGFKLTPEIRRQPVLLQVPWSFNNTVIVVEHTMLTSGMIV